MSYKNLYVDGDFSPKKSMVERYANDKQIGYHISDFPKGEIGKISKIEEELNELKDAENQNSKVMILIELSDLYGALEEYCITQGVTMEDLKIFSNITKRAFKNGCRE